MTQSLRAAHRILWLVLALAVGCIFVLALLLREPAHAETVAASLGIR